jgi:tRNA G46 methylase TrmB
MTFGYEDTKEYWDEIWDLDEHRREHVILDGSDGEEEFDKELRNRTVGKIVLDIGCGSGKFTLKIARKAKQVMGIDISTIGLAQARRNMTRTRLRNADFRLATLRVFLARRAVSTSCIAGADPVVRPYAIFRKRTEC